MPDTNTSSRIDRLWSYHQADPGNVSLLRDIAREGFATNAPEHALKALNALQAGGHSEANDEAAAIHLLTKLRQVDEACERARAARQAWPDDEAVRLEGGRALCNARLYNEALEWFNSEPFSEPALAQMAGELTLQSLWRLERLEEAAELGGALASQWPENPRILAVYSALLYDLERADEAFAAARQAYAISPAHAYDALHVLASEQIMKGDLPGALSLIDQAQVVRTDDGRIWLLKGSAKMVQGDMDGAVNDLNKALDIFPDHPGSHLTLAWLHISQKRLDEAEATVRKAITASPSFAESHGTLAVVLAMKGDKEEAQQSIRRAKMLDKDGFAGRYAQSLLDGNVSQQVPDLFKQVMARVGLKP
ncbi:MAG: tetratricopeptide repeat protein [Rubrivivax sp.]|nr:MAG: tetratricopeptide repeat protein [Rubrivivax sp.]